MSRLRTAACLALSIAITAGCASTQSVRITCVPREVSVYVDSRLLEGDRADLRTDRAHKIFAKGPGFEPRLVVVQPETGDDGRPGFDGEVCVRVVPIGMGRDLDLEIEPGEEEPAP